jgi:hypothetical protein
MAPPRQTDLFDSGGARHRALPDHHDRGPSLELSTRQLIDWQERVEHLQREVRQQRSHAAADQLSLTMDAAAGADPAATAAAIDPDALTPQNLNFWRWPSAPHQGAAIYFVIDRPPHLRHSLLLYVGETGRADRRWKGEHDCKAYLAAYCDALRRAGLSRLLSIRFWCDVPTGVAARRALERALIRRWWPPFNKESRDRWATPFTVDLG